MQTENDQQAPTDEWIDRQLELCEKATHGPWRDGFDDGSGRIIDDGHSAAYITVRGLYPSSQPPVVVRGGAYEGVPIGVLKQEDVDLIITAREGYPATLEALQAAQGELRTVYAILQGLHIAIDAMSHENIKEVVGQLLIAGADWLDKEAPDAS